ncbi:sulfatase-like hydrolase/transferase [Sporosarcina cascadiensis]|uniref:sulfatase-like hydrolase/transferase n=1 Tax=Sporosarcina cascadiensis TaxID=2660747 RepID=UPI00129AC321|nr:sulfatase-like hydrolase/transferase [Sporosarcina cascadiensis]
MQSLKKKLEYYKKLSNQIEMSISDNNLAEAQTYIDEYSTELDNSSAYAFRSILAFQQGEQVKAIDILTDGIKKHPFSFSLYYNKAFMMATLERYEDSLECYFNAVKYHVNEEDKQLALDGIQEVSQAAIKAGFTSASLREKLKEYENLLTQLDARVFPIDVNGVSMIRKPQQVGTTDEYMINMYNELKYANIDLQSRMLFKSELVKGSILSNKKVWTTTGAVVFPISKMETNATIQIKVNGEKFKFTKEHLPINQYHYIRITEPGIIEISSDSPIFVGHPIELEPVKKPVKLVMKIFVDGLSYQLLQDKGLKEIMPNTYQFFKKGFIAENCYTTSEWTLPSKSSINTGMYSTEHKMLHPEYFYEFSSENQLLAEYFKEAGYYCTNISTNWRTTPSLGYYRGFDRMIYQNFLGGMDAKDVIGEALEHLMTFWGQNNFMTISLMDLHNAPDEIENHLYSQIGTDIKFRVNKNKKGNTSVQTTYDENKIEKYLQEISRIDQLLSTLYDFVIKTYPNEDFSITLHSDHGQSFLENDFNLLSDLRLKIPFMIRGKNIPAETSKELIESVDILPAILKSSELSVPSQINGKLPKVLGGTEARESVVTQIIHPGQTYKAKVMKKQSSFFLESEGKVDKDLTIPLANYTTKIVDNITGIELLENCEKQTVDFENIVFNKVRNFLK